MLNGGTPSHSMYGSSEYGRNLISVSIREIMPRAGAEVDHCCGAAPVAWLAAEHDHLASAAAVNTWPVKHTWKR
eukprot:6471410-Amphidinium_carterae.1